MYTKWVSFFFTPLLCSGKYLASYARNAHVNARGSSCKVLATAVRSETKLHCVHTLSTNQTVQCTHTQYKPNCTVYTHLVQTNLHCVHKLSTNQTALCTHTQYKPICTVYTHLVQTKLHCVHTLSINQPSFRFNKYTVSSVNAVFAN